MADSSENVSTVSKEFGKEENIELTTTFWKGRISWVPEGKENQVFFKNYLKYFTNKQMVTGVHPASRRNQTSELPIFFLANGIESGKSLDSAAGLSRKFYHSLSRMTKSLRKLE